MTGPACPFCTLPQARIQGSNRSGFWVLDAHPITPGHSLVIPLRHIASFFETTAAERADLLELVDAAKTVIDAQHRPQGYNIGINDGPAAGQTVPHLHIHLIPRHTGDVADPRGGIRWVMPNKADYWSPAR